MQAPRLLPETRLPPFAYVPGHHGRPGEGHVLEHRSAPRQFAWGVDLFNCGFYWEAHEAWEGLWARSRRGSRRRLLLKGLILLAAAGVKARQSRTHGVVRHAARAEFIFRRLADSWGGNILGLSPGDLADQAAGVKDSAGAAGHGNERPSKFVLTPGDRLARLTGLRCRPPTTLLRSQ